jgi:thiamine kinase-like enzyme
MNEMVLSSIEDLTTDWLCRALDVPHVESFSHEKLIGEGYNSRMYRLSLNCSNDVPSSLILKLATDNEVFVKLLSGTALYREVKTYHLLGSQLGDLVPHMYVAEVDEGQQQVTLLMEDLGEIPHKPFRENLENSLLAVKNIASVHAKFWQPGETLTEAFKPLVGTIPQDEIVAQLREALSVNREREVPHNYLNTCIEHVSALLPYLVNDAENFKGPGTIVHGDFHCRNLHFINGQLKIFDWQQAQHAPAAQDIAYWMIMSVDVNDRAEFEPVLIDAYYTQLVKSGVNNYSRKQFLKDYRLAETGVIAQVYVAQSALEQNTEEQTLEVEDFLVRIDQAAKNKNLLQQLRIARVIMPILTPALRLVRQITARSPAGSAA